MDYTARTTADTRIIVAVADADYMLTFTGAVTLGVTVYTYTPATDDDVRPTFTRARLTAPSLNEALEHVGVGVGDFIDAPRYAAMAEHLPHMAEHLPFEARMYAVAGELAELDEVLAYMRVDDRAAELAAEFARVADKADEGTDGYYVGVVGLELVNADDE